MPNYSGPSNGTFPTTAALPIVANPDNTPATVTVAVPAVTSELFADGMPGLNAWFLQTGGVGVVTVQLQFMHGLTAANVIDWQPLIAPFVLAVGTPSLTNVSLGSARYRARLTSTGDATVLWRLAARVT